MPLYCATDSVSDSKLLNKQQINKNHDVNWVLDMFPPAFQLHVSGPSNNVTAEEIRVDGNSALQYCEKPDTEDIFARLACNNVSPLDIATIKNVFQRVWIMMQAYKKTEGISYSYMFIVCFLLWQDFVSVFDFAKLHLLQKSRVCLLC